MIEVDPVYGAVDWGGSWIRVGLVQGRRLLGSEKVRRPQSLESQYAAIADLLRSCEDSLDRKVEGVGVGIAGIVQGSEVVSAINLGIHRREHVPGALGTRLAVPTFVCNDVQAVAGSLRDRWPDEVVALLSMGTGIGGAVLLRGRVFTGAGAAGDFGHMVFEPNGQPCDCGGSGCLETVVSGRVLAAAASSLALSGESAVLRRIAAGRAVHAGDLETAADAGDEAALIALSDAAAALSVGLRSLVASLDPDRVVLLGAMLDPDTVFGTMLRERWSERRPSWSEPTLTFVREDGDSALVGAAAFAAERLQPDGEKQHS